MNIKVIKDTEEYASAMARLSSLMAIDPPAGSAEEDEIELLALVIADYERKVVPPVDSDPIEAILFRVDQAGLGRKDLIPYLGSSSKVSEVLSRRRPLSLAMVRRLHDGLGIPAEILIGSERHQDLIEAPQIDYTRFPLAEMSARGCFGEFVGGTGQLKEYAEDLLRNLFKALSFTDVQPALLRAPLHQRGQRRASVESLIAWQLCVLKKARAIELPRKYKRGSVTLSWLRDLSKLSTFTEGPRLAREYLANAGIILVIERHFKGTYLDGAAMLDQGSPVVALTLRHDRLDNFWFALLHELAHVGKHLDDANPFFIDDLDSRDEQDRKEKEADEMAMNALIPPEMWKKSVVATVKESRSIKGVHSLAHQFGVHPAIVAGRIRHDTKNYRLFVKVLGQGEPSRCLL